MNKENDIFNKVVKGAKDVKLTVKERTVLFSAVDNFVKKNPVRPYSRKVVQNEINWFNYIFQNGTRAVSFVLVVFIILGGSSSIAAEGALPGDLLYPVKININEGIKVLLTNNANRAGFEADRADLRLKEAETLAQNGKLTAEANDQIEAGFNAHVSQVEKDIQEYKNNGDLKKAYDLNSKLETSLKAREASLSDLKGVDESENDTQIGKIVSKVQMTLTSSTIAREQTEQSIVDSDKNDDNVRAVAESKRFAAKSLMDNLKAKSINSAYAKKTDLNLTIAPVSINSDSEQSADLLSQGEEKMKHGQYKDAYNLFQKAYDSALYGNISSDLEDDAQFNIDLNTDI